VNDWGVFKFNVTYYIILLLTLTTDVQFLKKAVSEDKSNRVSLIASIPLIRD